MGELKILIADDHPLLRSGVRSILNAQPDMMVVAECGDGLSIAPLAATFGAHVAVIDAILPSLPGAAATKKLLAARPNVKVVAFSAHVDATNIEAMLAAGAKAYVLKTSPADDLLRAIRSVARGETFIDPSIKRKLVPEKRRAGAALSAREHAVLRDVARGLSFKEIATALDVSVRSVETYRMRAMEKTSLRTRADIVRYAAERGWLLDE